MLLLTTRHALLGRPCYAGVAQCGGAGLEPRPSAPLDAAPRGSYLRHPPTPPSTLSFPGLCAGWLTFSRNSQQHLVLLRTHLSLLQPELQVPVLQHGGIWIPGAVRAAKILKTGVWGGPLGRGVRRHDFERPEMIGSFAANTQSGCCAPPQSPMGGFDWVGHGM
jgi:hypothetical protein